MVFHLISICAEEDDDDEEEDEEERKKSQKEREISQIKQQKASS